MFLVTFKYGFDSLGGWPKRELEKFNTLCTIKSYEVLRDDVTLVVSTNDIESVETIKYKMLIMFELFSTKTTKL